MEARGEPQHRTQVNPRKAGLPGQACRLTQRPISNRGRTVVGAAAAGSHSYLTPRDLPWSGNGRGHEGNDAGSMPGEKSDRPVVARKPVKAGGAKGAMGFEA